MKLGMLAAGLIAVMAPVAAVNAAVVTATSVVSGGPGAYTHTFTLINNSAAGNSLYFFGVDLVGTLVGTPASWADAGFFTFGWSNESYGGSATVYSSVWCCANVGTSSGTSTTGFSVLSAVNPTTVKFFAFGYGSEVPANDGHFNTTFNPGYEGVVNGAAVPEPASWAMLIAGFGLVGAAARRRRSVVAA